MSLVTQKTHGRQGKRSGRQIGISNSDCNKSLLIHQTLHHYWYWTAGQYTRFSIACASQQTNHIGLTVHLQALLVFKNGALEYSTNCVHIMWKDCIVKYCFKQIPWGLLKMLTGHHFTLLNSVRLKNLAWLGFKWDVLLCCLFTEEK